MLFIICALVCIQVYLMKWIVPVYQKADPAVISSAKAIINPNTGQGFWYLLVLAVVTGLIILSLTVRKKRI